MGSLKDPMDKKADAHLKRAWEAIGISFRPALATTCVPRTLAMSVE